MSLIKEGAKEAARQTVSKADGSFSTKIAPGRYGISAIADGFSEVVFNKVEVRASQELIYRSIWSRLDRAEHCRNDAAIVRTSSGQLRSTRGSALDLSGSGRRRRNRKGGRGCRRGGGRSSTADTDSGDTEYQSGPAGGPERKASSKVTLPPTAFEPGVRGL